MNVPSGWRRVNEVCIGVPDESGGWLYTVFHVGEHDQRRWEAWRGKGLLAMNLESIDAAVNVCREDYRRRK